MLQKKLETKAFFGIVSVEASIREVVGVFFCMRFLGLHKNAK